MNYPSPEHLQGKTAEELAAELRPISHNNCSIKRAEKILELVRMDGQTTREHQESRDAITRSIAGDLEHYRKQLEIVETAIETMLPSFNCTLMTMPGIDVTPLRICCQRLEISTVFPTLTSWRNSPEYAQSTFHQQGKEKICARCRETGGYRQSFISWRSR